MKSIRVPLIAIKNNVLFPNSALPLEITDPSCKIIIRDSAKIDGLVGVSLGENIIYSSPSSPEGYIGKLEPKSIFTIGKPTILSENSEGVMKVFIQGIVKAKIINLVQELPYHIFEAEPIYDQANENKPDEEIFQKLFNIMHRWCFLQIPVQEERAVFMDQLNNKKSLIDYISMLIISNIQAKQHILECNSFNERTKLINILLNENNPFIENPEVTKAILDFQELNTNIASGH